MSGFRPDFVNVPRYKALGVPPNAFVISNSERMTLGCDRQWLFSYGMGLVPPEEARALKYGAAWAEVQEDIHRWWMETGGSPYPFDQVLAAGVDTKRPKDSCPWCAHAEVDCTYCEGTRLSRPFLILADWREDERQGRLKDAAREGETLFNAIVGYRACYGDQPPDGYSVVGVELEVAAPILHPDGKPFKSKIPLIEEESIYRVAKPGEEPTLWAIMPWWQVGKIDVLWRENKSGTLWVQDAKTSRDPAGYLRNVTVDPQLPGYCWMLEEGLKQGVFDFEGHIGGVQFDVASSSLQRRPARLADKEVSKTEISAAEKAIDEDLMTRPAFIQGMERLKNEALATGKKWTKAAEADARTTLLQEGSLGVERQIRRDKIVRWKPPAYSQASNVTTPSWLYVDTLRTAPLGPDGQSINFDDYREHIGALRLEIDPKLYIRESFAASRAMIDEYRLELVGIARQLAEKIRGIPFATPQGLAVNFPRTPLCRKPGGFCAFTSVCAGGITQGTEVFDDFECRTGLTWAKKPEGSK